jgi:hypothetical protein
MRIFGWVIALFLGLSVLTLVGWGLRVALLPARVIDRGFSTVEGVVDKTLTPENAIYNYEWFKEKLEAIQATKNKAIQAEAKIIAFEESAGERKDWTFEDKTEHARLNAVHTGITNQIEDLVAEYNARAKMATRNIFQDGKIPSILEMGSDFLR